jgi:hypothetical protein
MALPCYKILTFLQKKIGACFWPMLLMFVPKAPAWSSGRLPGERRRLDQGLWQPLWEYSQAEK